MSPDWTLFILETFGSRYSAIDTVLSPFFVLESTRRTWRVSRNLENTYNNNVCFVLASVETASKRHSVFPRDKSRRPGNETRARSDSRGWRKKKRNTIDRRQVSHARKASDVVWCKRVRVVYGVKYATRTRRVRLAQASRLLQHHGRETSVGWQFKCNYASSGLGWARRVRVGTARPSSAALGSRRYAHRHSVYVYGYVVSCHAKAMLRGYYLPSLFSILFPSLV